MGCNPRRAYIFVVFGLSVAWTFCVFLEHFLGVS